MIDPRLEEQAALAAVGWSDDQAGMERAAGRNAEVAEAVRGFNDVAGWLAYDAPQFEPPPALRANILAALGRAPAAAPAPLARPKIEPQRILNFPRIALVPYALAACLMGVALFQAVLILLLDDKLDLFRSAPQHHDPFNGVQLVDLAPQNPTATGKVMVAWDPRRCCGMLSMDNLPPAPAGSDYQLWVLDPSKPAPISAGLVQRGVGSQHFIAGDVHMTGRPGFAISMEPAGGRPVPTEGQIFFAVAPSP